MPSSLEGVCSTWLNVAKGVKIDGIALNVCRTGSTEEGKKGRVQKKQTKHAKSILSNEGANVLGEGSGASATVRRQISIDPIEVFSGDGKYTHSRTGVAWAPRKLTLVALHRTSPRPQ